MSISAPLGAISGGELTGTEFGQRLSIHDQEAFQINQDFYDRHANSQHLEVYMHYAAIERQREAEDPRPVPDASWTVAYKTLTGQKHKIVWGDEPNPVVVDDEVNAKGPAPGVEGTDTEKGTGATVGGLDSHGEPSQVSTAERERLYRALRVASWQAVFYLITTDILGFTAASKTFQEMGYIAGVLVYFFFYLLAIFAGQVIWKLYLSLDSVKYPVICYADLGERVFGRWVRHVFNIFQSGQLLFNVALLINGNAQVLADLADFRAGTCFLIMCLVFYFIGAFIGQIQSLKNFAWFANCNIWLNIVTMILTLYGIATSAPVPQYSYHTTLGPIDVSTWIPAYAHGWFNQVEGVQLAVFAYGGAMIFPEFMAEMRKPHDFWKAAACAQFFCFFTYMLFGLLVYSYQGQYASILPGLDFSNRAIIYANNVIGLFTIMIAAVLYGNIGVKVFYENVLRAYFKFPSFLAGRGRLYFALTVIVYWAVAYVIAVTIPFLSALVTIVGALFILQFTYTFPPLLCVGFWMQIDALKGDRPWEPGMVPGSNRVDTWKDKSRWSRGFSKFWYAKAFLILMFVAAVVNSVLGVYAGVKQAQSSFAAGIAKPWACKGPSYPTNYGSGV
ncbi:transmembrane amino acid transporter protein-domain-containing protein [Neohortaea acidophila]|uniref:Transmembrane amino acid transporter protein-domain-containing protein n=1 Tax=Neohortaea acidophila TaxID=245834 RepID=A0A6A6Q1F1_9PEZI|nr:transmembrane amino acid transporter protein-domain-containing protein [Neohortaea acidophila]KAF2485816.1 transmembrane amino acid transporter protein-domain-containing protein [Neohortaea acidophila]